VKSGSENRKLDLGCLPDMPFRRAVIPGQKTPRNRGIYWLRFFSDFIRKPLWN